MKLKVGSFEKNVLTLMPGSVISQAVPILAFPLLARLYTPGDFGTASLFVNITSICIIFATLRLEPALFYSKDRGESQKVLNTIVFWILAFSLFIFPFVFVLKSFLPKLLNNPNLGEVLIYLPLSVLFTSLYTVFLTWLNYCGDYKGLSFNRGLRTCMEVLIKLGISSFGFLGLIVGGLIGLFISILHLYKRSKKFLSFGLFTPVDKTAIVKKYSHLPCFQIPGQLTSVLNLAMPIMFISHWTTQEFLGLFVVAHRIAHIPVNSLGGAIGEVFRSEAAQEVLDQGHFFQSYKRTLYKLAPISVIIFGLGYLLCPYVFPLFLGGKWDGVEGLFRALCPMFALQFVARPLAHSLDMAQRQKFNFYWQGLTLLVMVVALYYSFTSSLERESQVLCFSLAYSFCYLLSISLSFWSSRNPLKVEQR